MNPEGNTLLTASIPNPNKTSAANVTALLFTILLSSSAYLVFILLNFLLNLSNALSSTDFLALRPWCGFKIMAHNTGVRVSATKPDMTIAQAIVIENCLKKTPTGPDMK